jgi:hypothetical protein
LIDSCKFVTFSFLVRCGKKEWIKKIKKRKEMVKEKGKEEGEREKEANRKRT